MTEHEWRNDPSLNPALGRRNLVWGWAIFALFWALFAGTIVVAMIYLAVAK